MIANPHDSDFALLDAIFLDGRPVEGLSSQELIPWFNQPHIQSAITQLRSISDTVVALRHARARFAAIESLDQLCQSAPNPTDRLRASIALLKPLPEGAVGAGPAEQTTTPSPRTHHQSEDSTPEPLPEGGVGVGFDAPPPTTNGRFHNHAADDAQEQPATSSDLPATNPDPNTGSEISGSEFSCSELSASQTSDLRFEIPPAQNPPTPPALQTPPPAASQSLLHLLAHLDDQYNDDLADAEIDIDDSDDSDAALDAAEDAALDRHAAAVEAHLGVPITHPEILKAISELRIHDLDAIAARIRAESRAFDPEGVQASSRGQSEESPTSAAHASSRKNPRDPEGVAALEPP